MKCRRKFSLKLIFILITLLILYILAQQLDKLISQLNSLYVTHHFYADDNSIKSRNLFHEIPFIYYQRSNVQNIKFFDRRLTKTQLSDALFQIQGNFTLPTLKDLFEESLNLPPNMSALPIFPFESKSIYDDRIWNQMRYVPENSQKDDTAFKHILLYHGLIDVSNNSFTNCPVNKCFVSGDPELASQADVILWMHTLTIPVHHRPPGQIWALYLLESPFHTPKFPNFQSLGSNYSINWTATYRHDSTLVTPYFKYTPYDLTRNFSKRFPLPKRNYALGKTKLIAWFVSNCGSLNNRLQIVEELQQYIKVDIYGQCGPLKCSRSDYKSCFSMLSRNYKFYLAFENSNCRDYITEKFFLNGLSNDVLPIVMGAPEEDYQRVAPPHSFIHVDKFSGVAELANYLYFLNKNDFLYNEYFAWKEHGLVDTNSFFWCRLCMLSHEGDKIQSQFPNVYNWWFDKSHCTLKLKNFNDSTRTASRKPS